MLLLLIGLIHSPPAHAWESAEWCPEDLPHTWYLGDCPGEEGLSAEEFEGAVRHAFAAWEDLGCEELALVDGGLLDGECPGLERDGRSTISFGDPHGDLAGGVLGAQLAWNAEGETCKEEVDLIVAQGGYFLTDARIEAGECEWEVSLEGFLAREVGTMLGLGHTCEEGDPCSEEEAAATMYWTTSTCDTSRSSPNAADRRLLSELLGVEAGISCDSDSGRLTCLDHEAKPPARSDSG